MFSRDEMLAYRRRMTAFQEWKADHPAPPRELSSVLADLNWLRSRVPPEERRRDPDPLKAGIARMRAMLAAVRTPHV